MKPEEDMPVETEAVGRMRAAKEKLDEPEHAGQRAETWACCSTAVARIWA